MMTCANSDAEVSIEKAFYYIQHFVFRYIVSCCAAAAFQICHQPGVRLHWFYGSCVNTRKFWDISSIKCTSDGKIGKLQGTA